MAALSEPEIDGWLRKTADSISCPLKKKKVTKRFCDVTLGIELYKYRYSNTFSVEFVIFNPDVASLDKPKPENPPIFVRRMTNLDVARPNGSHPDFITDGEDELKLPYLKEQLVIQGNRLFQNVHSLDGLFRAYTGQIPEVPIERGHEGIAEHLARKIATFLA